MLSGLKSIHWIPILTLLSAVWAEERPRRTARTTGMINLTGTNGKPDLVQAAHIYAVHEGNRRIKNDALTQIHAVGRKPFLVRESVNQVMAMLAGDWVRLELAKVQKPVLVDIQRISTIEESILKRRSAVEPFSNIIFVDGSRLRVRESTSTLRSLLGSS